MIPLTNNNSTTTQVLQVSLGGAATTTYPTCTVCNYIVPRQTKTVMGENGGSIAGDPSEYQSAPEFTLLTTSAATTISAAPPTGSTRDIHNICIYNADTVSATATVSILDNVTTRVLKKVVLLTLESLNYDNGRGWYCMDANGNIKEVTSSVFSSLTVATGIGVGGAAAQSSGIAFPASQIAVADANTLDDYEEGTFTVSDNSGASLVLTSVAGRYTKIGRLLTYGFTATYPSTVDASTAALTGLPFTVSSGNDNRQGFRSETTEATLLQCYPNAGAITISLATSAGGIITNATLSTDLMFCGGFYTV